MKKLFLTVFLLCATQMFAAEQAPVLKIQLATPTLWLLSPVMLACNLTNVDKETHHVQVRIITNGKVLLESKVIALEPKHTTNHKVEGSSEGGPLYCEFMVEGKKEMYRGVAVLFNGPKGTDTVAVPAH